jgi:3-oxoacyl-[acyl-carrier-protein] synthase II
VLVLEELEHAKARGARIYAEYVGGAFTCDAHHMTEPQPQGRGVSTCLHKALQSAGMGRHPPNKLRDSFSELLVKSS